MSISSADPGREIEHHELPLPIAFLLSAVLSTLIAIITILYFDRSQSPVLKPTIVRVVLLQLPAPPAPPQVAPPPEPLALPPPAVLATTPTGTVVLSPAPSLTPPHKPSRPRRPTHAHLASRLTKPSSTTPQAIVSVQTKPPAPTGAARPALSDPAARDKLEARIKQAIRSAFRFPEAAREMGSHGTAVVGFLYRDRLASFIHLVASSRSSVLDLQAVQIVRDAALPPPGKLAGQTLNLEVPIVFDIVSDDD